MNSHRINAGHKQKLFVCLDILRPNINNCCGNKQISNLVNRNLNCRCASAYTEICAKIHFATYSSGLGTKQAL